MWKFNRWIQNVKAKYFCLLGKSLNSFCFLYTTLYVYIYYATTYKVTIAYNYMMIYGIAAENPTINGKQLIIRHLKWQSIQLREMMGWELKSYTSDWWAESIKYRSEIIYKLHMRCWHSVMQLSHIIAFHNVFHEITSEIYMIYSLVVSY